MRRFATPPAVALAAALVSPRANAVELDPKIVGFTLPKDIKWTEKTRSEIARSGRRQAEEEVASVRSLTLQSGGPV
jgi:hypothetical protein